MWADSDVAREPVPRARLSLSKFEAEQQFEEWQEVPEAWINSAMPRLSARECEEVLRDKIIPFCWLPHCVLYAAASPLAIQKGRRFGMNLAGKVPPALYRKMLRRHLAPHILERAVLTLQRHDAMASAHKRLSQEQWVLGAAAALATGLLLLTGKSWIILLLAQLAAACFFALVVGLRILCAMPLPKGEGVVARLLSDTELPIYTVLVPLFRETDVLRKLIASLEALDYPRDKLDIKIILEDEDRVMHKAVYALGLPWHYDVIIVPPGKPQTKPRALNYAAQFARGSLITIYDGEDMPEPNQLRLAAARFNAADEGLACLQASLDFFNASENWLTRHFTTEYAALFRVILPTLAAYGLPLPLGGTSNHFRHSALKAVGYWDPFNVTEDADLGIRLARHGFRTGILDSTTLEEANTQFGNWIKQRRRWLKGFLQTWLVHNRNPALLLREIGLRGFLTVQTITLGVYASALLHPFLIAIALWRFLPGNFSEITSTLFGQLMSGVSVVILISGYASAISTSRKGLRRIGARGWSNIICTIPVYWLLVSLAAWLALWDFVVAPFHWHKTRHGLTRQRPKPTATARS